MKYLIINGSPHKCNTWKLVELIRDDILSMSSESNFEEIHLKDLELPFCTGCSLCFRKGYKFCPHNSIMQNILDKMDGSDGIIFATTTFNMLPNSLAKNFIDHLCFMLHRPHFFKNKAVVVSTTGGVGGKSAVKYVAGTLKAIGFNRCYKLPVCSFSWNDYQPNEKTKNQCRKLAVKFHKDVASKKLHSPTFTDLLTYNLFRGMSRGYVKGNEYETEDGVHWSEAVRAKKAFDPAIPVPIYKIIFGNMFYLIGKMASKLVTVTYKK